MKKIYLIVALAASFLVTPVWAKLVDYRVAFGVFESEPEVVGANQIGRLGLMPSRPFDANLPRLRSIDDSTLATTYPG